MIEMIERMEKRRDITTPQLFYYTLKRKVARLLIRVVFDNIRATWHSHWSNDTRVRLHRKEILLIGKEVVIHPKVVFQGTQIIILSNSLISTGCRIGNETFIGQNVLLAPFVQTITTTHDVYTHEVINGKIWFGSNVWVGQSAIILPNVIIGKNAVIGAGSVVTKNVPENAIVAGNPAKVIRYKRVEA